MDTDMLTQIRDGQGFLAALDQSGGSTPKALADYGISEEAYANEQEMFDRVHEMRTRIITSAAFTGERILGAILFACRAPATCGCTTGSCPSSRWTRASRSPPMVCN